MVLHHRDHSVNRQVQDTSLAGNMLHTYLRQIPIGWFFRKPVKAGIGYYSVNRLRTSSVLMIFTVVSVSSDGSGSPRSGFWSGDWQPYLWLNK